MDKEFDKICALYVKEQAFWVMSGRSPEEIRSRRNDFIKTYSSEITSYMNLNVDRIREISGQNFPVKFNARLEGEGYTAEEIDLVNDALVSPGLGRDNMYNRMAGVEYEEPSQLEKDREDSLNQFHQWLYRNAGKAGFEFLGSKGNHREYLEHNFMNADREIQKMTLFYLEQDIRKLDDNGRNSVEVKAEYAKYKPDYEKIRGKMIATRWKFWKRPDGSYLYWNKLKDAFNKAKADYARQHDKERIAQDKDLHLGEPGQHMLEKPVHGQTDKDAFTNAMKDGFDYTSEYAMLDKAIVSGLNLRYGTETKLPVSNILLGRDFTVPAKELPYDARFLGGNGAADSISSFFKLVTTAKAAKDNFMEGLDYRDAKSTLGTVGDFGNSIVNAGFAAGAGATLAKGICDIFTAVRKTGEMIKKGVSLASEGISKIGTTVTAWAGLIANGIKACVGFVESLKFWKGNSHAKQAKEALKKESIFNMDENAMSEDEKEKLKNRAELLQDANKRKGWGSAFPKILAGCLGVAAGILSICTFGLAPAVAAGIGLATGIVFFLGEKLAGMWPSRKNKREAVDLELMKNSAEGKENIEHRFANNRKNAYEDLLKDKNKASVVNEIQKQMNIGADKVDNKKSLFSKWFHRHVGNINRRNVEADMGLMNHDEAYTFVKGKIEEDALNKIYGSKTANGVLQNISETEFKANKEILRAMGVKSKHLEVANADNKEKAFEKAKHVAVASL